MNCLWKISVVSIVLLTFIPVLYAATVVDVYPPLHSIVPWYTDISATIDLPVDQGTVNSNTFVVHGNNHSPVPGSFSFSDPNTILFDPEGFHAGEIVETSVTGGITAQTDPVIPVVWRFRVAVTGGDGNYFSDMQTISDAPTISSDLGDVDGDGDLDVYIAFGHPIYPVESDEIWLNNGSGNFTDSGQSLTALRSTDVQLGDLDNDGDLDAFVTSGEFSGSTPVGVPDRVFFNDGSGIFTDSGQNIGNSYSTQVVLGDVDGDGDLDAAVATAYDSSKIFLNNGSGIFTDNGQILGGYYNIGICLGDTDNDGDLDMFLGNVMSADELWLNDGQGSFSDSLTYYAGTDTAAVEFGDLDGDGDLDLFTANSAMSGEAPCRVLINQGTNYFLDSGQSLGNAKFLGVTLGDVDNDGDLDAIAISENPYENKLFLNDGTGTFSDSGQNLGENYSTGLSSGDVDGDGDLDAVITSLGATGTELTIHFNGPRPIPSTGPIGITLLIAAISLLIIRKVR